MKCKRCGAYIKPGNKFCEKCGERVVTTYSVKSHKENNSNALIIILCVIVIVVIVGLIIFSITALTKTNDSETNNASSNYTSSTVAQSSQSTGNITHSSSSSSSSRLSSSSSKSSSKSSSSSSIGKDFVLANSDTRLISKSELTKLSDWELLVARNEIYARRGRKFDSQELRDYFYTKSWYRPSVEPNDFTESMLNDIEIQNVKTIVEYEQEK